MARSNVRRASLALRRHPAPNFISIHVIRLFVAATVGVILLSLGPCSGSRDPGILGASAAQVPLQAPPKPRKLAFRLSSIIHRGSDRTFAEAELAESLAALSVPVSASSRLDYVRYGPENIHAAQDGRDMLVPDHTDPQTVLALAYMAYNAYSLPPSDSFHSVPGWNLSTGFGWAEDGIRGYVFTTFEEERGHTEAEGEVIAVSIKGTSPGAFGVGGPTSGKDKYNVSLIEYDCGSMQQ